MERRCVSRAAGAIEVNCGERAERNREVLKRESDADEHFGEKVLNVDYTGLIDNGANLNDDMPEGGNAIIVVERITQIDEGKYRTCIKMVVRNYPQVGKSQLLTMDEFRAYKQKREGSIGLSSSIVLFTR